MPKKPRVGDVLYQADGKTEIGKVVSVEKGQNFSVTIQKPSTKRTTVITEFYRWQKRHGWTFR